jgi:hypothetical protein
MSEKQVVSRSVASALGIICIILTALVAYFTVTVISAQNSYNNLQDENKQLQTWLAGNITDLQNQVNNLTDILNLRKSTIWYNGTLHIVPLLELTSLEENAPYAGYVSVQVSSSQSNETIVEVVYANQVLRYDNSISLGSSGTAVFPVLPSGMVIYFAPPEFMGSSFSYTATVTITYYY